MPRERREARRVGERLGRTPPPARPFGAGRPAAPAFHARTLGAGRTCLFPSWYEAPTLPSLVLRRMRGDTAWGRSSPRCTYR